MTAKSRDSSATIVTDGLPEHGKGYGIAFLRLHVADADGHCLIWPLFRDPDTGYGRMGHGGGFHYSHRVMCELVNGPAPTPKHQATHGCGNGHGGCVHPRHLTWQTNTENQLDRHKHGTFRKRGEPRAKLTQQDVDRIRAIKGYTKSQLAKEYGVSRDTITKVLDGRTWKGTPPIYNRRFPAEVRDRMVAKAAQLKAAGATLDHIASEIGVSRITARSYAIEGQSKSVMKSLTPRRPQ